jgi:hypothetical protein
MTKLFVTAAALSFLGGTLAHADPLSITVKALIAEEAAKCANGVGVPGGCAGPNGFVIKTLRNGVKDVTEGTGDHNELFGKDGWVRRTFGW